MILPDLNLLLYAYNPFASEHKRAHQWWQTVLGGGEIIGLPHEIPLGFVRIATHARMGSATVPLEAARRTVQRWLSHHLVRVLIPKEDHILKVLDLMNRSRVAGAIVSDASLAVYAIEHRATLCTNDTDFSRFPGLDWRNPLH